MKRLHDVLVSLGLSGRVRRAVERADVGDRPLRVLAAAALVHQRARPPAVRRLAAAVLGSRRLHFVGRAVVAGEERVARRRPARRRAARATRRRVVDRLVAYGSDVTP